MSMIKPKRWTPRSLLAVQLPHLFRRPKSPQEWIGPSTERVPLDAHTHHEFIKRKQKKFKSGIISVYGVNNRPSREHRENMWSVATGSWVPSAWLQATHIYPPSLGKMVEMETIRTQSLWTAGNGLMLPRNAIRALDDWALTIVPSDPDSFSITDRPLQYRFKILDSGHNSLRGKVYPDVDTSGFMALQLHNRELSFWNNNRPLVEPLYFHSCCAMWKVTCLQNPEVTDGKEFWELYLGNLKALWSEQLVTRSYRLITEIFYPKEQVDQAKTQSKD
ncbi:hypothetical protein VP1G_00912 [Cytospora mali]|uniref:HNH nuclease domain-containing protein n=1 Tax=Cytospora mali TaxID=578113 RepID=A0A194UPG4_CYTMA|nr:hypothetical protein VP1G_00912 [Valsa mali var. pyri (nom. inval.)]